MEREGKIWAVIASAQRGDRKAFDEIVRHYTGTIESLIRSELGTQLERKVEVEDLLQETFLRAYQSMHQFRGHTEETFQCWLSTIARHVIQDEARHLHSQKADSDRVVSLELKVKGNESGSGVLGASLEAKVLSPSKALSREERSDLLKKALSDLPPLDREVIVLARLEGLPVKEVAQRIGRSPNETSVLLLRALLKLKALLGKREDLCSS